MSQCSGPVFGSVRSVSRRDFLRRAGGGFGLLALASLLNRDGLLAADAVTEKPLAHPNPLAPRPPHYTPRARAVIFLFMSGGPSHVDLFDPKPDLIRLAGQPIPESFGAFKTRRDVAKNNLFPPLRPFHKHGQSGIEVSDLLPNHHRPLELGWRIETMNFGSLRQIGPYEMLAPLGEGGMGEVFRARDTRLNRDVAVKVLPKDFVADADRLRRFEQEAKTLAALNHPNVLTIHDAGVHEGAPYLISELLESKTLREVLGSTANAALPVRKATEYALQMAHGLAAAHGKGIIHRDLKPENIFISRTIVFKPPRTWPSPLKTHRACLRKKGVSSSLLQRTAAKQPGGL